MAFVEQKFMGKCTNKMQDGYKRTSHAYEDLAAYPLNKLNQTVTLLFKCMRSWF